MFGIGMDRGARVPLEHPVIHGLLSGMKRSPCLARLLDGVLCLYL